MLDWHSKLEEEITSIARNHKDYEILKSFHGLYDILIATLIAYYWDIDRSRLGGGNNQKKRYIKFLTDFID